VHIRDDLPVPTLAIGGDIDREAERPILSAWDRLNSAPGDRVLLDFTDVSYINSTGIAVVVGVLARARAEGRPLGVYGLSDHYRHVFEITRLIDFMEVYPDAEMAHRSVAAPSTSFNNS
jgi:anti-anti-sigma factor